MPVASCRRSPPGSSPSSPTAWSITCSTNETASATECRRIITNAISLQAQRHKARIAVRRHHQQHCRLLAVLLKLFDALLKFGGICYRLLLDLGDDHSRREPLLSSR